ncbi:MAG: fatty acid cis/trans isomerase [Hyphomicrobiaceae bacterium]|nr:fatty acid cis/trans isomerase [Hyphomicrobiaceae bacterium]
MPLRTVDYMTDVRPVLDKRCVVCHACYDAPCQLKLSSLAGIKRGASKIAVYEPARLSAINPTRLFVDAGSTAEWRRKGFFSVTERNNKAGLTPRNRSLLMSMLRHGRSHPFVESARLPKEVPLDITRKLSCPSSNENQMDEYVKKHLLGGMPYGMAALPEKDYQILYSWAIGGARGKKKIWKRSKAVEKRIEAFEKLLNGTRPKHRLASRYLYEHLFLAHLVFRDIAPDRYFRLVRSRSPHGQPVDEINSRHPSSFPGKQSFFYRLRPVVSSIVHKTHMVFSLEPSRIARLEDLFFKSDWDISKLPDYEKDTAANPFQVFAAIPASVRYQFLLENARFFVMNFIRGPACRGQAALNVIDDHFFLAFLNPKHDLSVQDPAYLQRAKNMIEVPLNSSSPVSLLVRWRNYYASHRRYLAFREKAYYKTDPAGKTVSLDSLWGGNAYNRNSFLTVFRHFDSASVVNGFVGEIPKTLLVLDYPVFERMYYDLVVNFDVFGNVTHQLLSRLSMDYLRMEGEDIALGFFPPGSREIIRNGWYRGAGAQLSLFLAHKMPSRKRGTAVGFKSADYKGYKNELIEKVMQRFPQLNQRPDLLNRCKMKKQDTNPPRCRWASALMPKNNITELRKLAARRSAFVRQMPDLAFLRVKRTDKSGDSRVFSIIRNKAHSNVAFIFGEQIRRRVEEDTLTIVEGFVGSYPNFFFEVEDENIADFTATLRAVKSPDAFRRFVEQYGVRRTSSRFWKLSDWFVAKFYSLDSDEAGLFDLNRYQND